ncbi:MAG: SbcC/MukB-like Walker B domain-containing protein, partial [Bacillota bacterium]|nr:SbcC/MukB-like Walker B domain-containing protein [Bacillota bacterium]
ERKRSCLLEQGQSLLKELQSRERSLESSRKEQERLREEESSVRKQCQALRDRLDDLCGQLLFCRREEAEKDLQASRGKLERWNRSYDEVEQGFRKAETAAQAAAVRLGQLQSQLAEAQRMAETAEKELRCAAISRMGSWELYRRSLRSEEEKAVLQKRISDFGQEKSALAAEKSSLERSIQGRALPDLEGLQQEQLQLRAQREQLQQAQNRILSRLDRNRLSRDSIRRIAEKTAEQGRKCAMLQDLSDTLNGTLKGKQKITLERYIQSAYFDRVLESANQRLSRMSEGRFQLRRRVENAHSAQSGLELDVFDEYTGSQRDVRSMSGGESFKASLALALGLADVVQAHAGGVQLEAMFIDEGFGSLDGDSLEQAMRVLEQLSSGKRLVGIISHVEELRQRIDRKLIVKGGPRGSHLQPSW